MPLPPNGCISVPFTWKKRSKDMRLVLIADSLAGISHLDAKHILGNALDLHFLHYVGDSPTHYRHLG